MSSEGDEERFIDDRSLSQRINDVLTDWLADEGGGFPTAFYVVAEYIDCDGDKAWLDEFADGQTIPGTLGLLEWGRGCLAWRQQQQLSDMDSEE